MPIALKDFQPLKTHHCVTGSMRNVYQFNDHPLSEDLLLGLGAGMGFVYWHTKGVLPFLGGRANVGRSGEEGLERTAGRRTGVKVEVHSSGSARKAEKDLLDLLTAGQPMMLQVDMGFLSYLNLPAEFHFGWHVIVAAGFDLDQRQVWVADRDGVLHPIRLEELAQARASKYKPFPPRNTWWSFDFESKRQPTPEETRQAIAEGAHGMLYPPIANLGVRGIHTAATRILRWQQSMSVEDLRLACFNVFIFIDATGGSGGGLFRIMYGRFLKEAAEIAREPRLDKAGESMQAIGDTWQVVASLLREASTSANSGAALPEASQLLMEIAGREQAVWTALQAAVA